MLMIYFKLYDTVLRLYCSTLLILCLHLVGVCFTFIKLPFSWSTKHIIRGACIAQSLTCCLLLFNPMDGRADRMGCAMLCSYYLKKFGYCNVCVRCVVV